MGITPSKESWYEPNELCTNAKTLQRKNTKLKSQNERTDELIQQQNAIKDKMNGKS